MYISDANQSSTMTAPESPIPQQAKCQSPINEQPSTSTGGYTCHSSNNTLNITSKYPISLSEDDSDDDVVHVPTPMDKSTPIIVLSDDDEFRALLCSDVESISSGSSQTSIQYFDFIDISDTMTPITRRLH